MVTPAKPSKYFGLVQTFHNWNNGRPIFASIIFKCLSKNSPPFCRNKDPLINYRLLQLNLCKGSIRITDYDIKEAS